MNRCAVCREEGEKVIHHKEGCEAVRFIRCFGCAAYLMGGLTRHAPGCPVVGEIEDPSDKFEKVRKFLHGVTSQFGEAVESRVEAFEALALIEARLTWEQEQHDSLRSQVESVKRELSLEKETSRLRLEDFYAAQAELDEAVAQVKQAEKERDAVALAAEAHAGQVDKQGAPYILHPLRVMAASLSEDKVVAVLHDVLEDTDQYEDRVRSLVSPSEWEALKALTRDDSETYKEFIERVRKNPQARRVKFSDLSDNFGRNPPEHLRRRYESALAVLTAADSLQETKS